MKIPARKRAVLGIKFIANMTRKIGKFNYEFDISSGKKFKKYNILRHCGCMFAMSEIVPSIKSIEERRKVMSKITKSLNWLESRRIKTYKKSKIVLDNKSMVKLGANAIAIMAILSYNKNVVSSYKERSKNIDLCIDLATHLENCLKKNGQLSPHKFNFDTKKTTSFQSDFYPGEIMLAFCMLAKFNFNDKGRYINSAIKVMHHLRENRDKMVQTRDHWQLQAMEMLYKMVGKDEKKFIMDYAKRIAKVEPITPSRFLSVPGGPIAARTEGLLAYYSIAKEKWALTEINKNINRLAEFQITKGPYTGCLLYEIGKPITRIDHSQHGSLAFFKYADIVGNEKI